MSDPVNNMPPGPPDDDALNAPPIESAGNGNTPGNPPSTPVPPEANDDDMGPRLERLGGEPAPDITPDEFARLQQAGQIHIDPRGRVRATDRNEPDAGISLRKRRAWYGA